MFCSYFKLFTFLPRNSHINYKLCFKCLPKHGATFVWRGAHSEKWSSAPTQTKSRVWRSSQWTEWFGTEYSWCVLYIWTVTLLSLFLGCIFGIKLWHQLMSGGICSLLVKFCSFVTWKFTSVILLAISWLPAVNVLTVQVRWPALLINHCRFSRVRTLATMVQCQVLQPAWCRASAKDWLVSLQSRLAALQSLCRRQVWDCCIMLE